MNLILDLNRNFDHKWLGKFYIKEHYKMIFKKNNFKVSGASANPCSEVFSGPYAGSEPETRALMKYIINKAPRWISYISLHAYGALWLSPYS